MLHRNVSLFDSLRHGDFFRFWGDETYERLLAIKKTWDPEMVFSCRHCVGDGDTPGIVTKTTRPSWRFQNNK